MTFSPFKTRRLWSFWKASYSVMMRSMMPMLSIRLDPSSFHTWLDGMKFGLISAYWMLSSTNSSRHCRVYFL